MSSELERLQARRFEACRLRPELALATVDEAGRFLHERGLLTLTTDSALPSLFGAVHEKPYREGGRGFAAYPRTKWWWGGALAERAGVTALKIHRGGTLFISQPIAACVDTLARAELVQAAEGSYGAEAARLVEYLEAAGPSPIDDVKAELGLDAASLRRLRSRLERVAALVSLDLRLEARAGGHRHSSEIRRWDQLGAPRSSGSSREALAELVVAGVRAAVVAPSAELASWFAWSLPPGLEDERVELGRLRRVAPGWVAGATAEARGT